MALRIMATTPHPALVTLPWDTPLEEWEGPFLVALPRGSGAPQTVAQWEVLPGQDVIVDGSTNLSPYLGWQPGIGAVRGRHYATVRGHRIHDPGGHGVANSGDAGGQVIR